MPLIPMAGERAVALALGPVDSGLDADACRVTWRAEEGATEVQGSAATSAVIFSGGLPVTGWKPSSGARPSASTASGAPSGSRRRAWPQGLGVLEAAMPQGAMAPFTLRVGDAPATLARHPNAPPADDLDRNYAGQSARVTGSSYVNHAPPATTVLAQVRAAGPTPRFPPGLAPGDAVSAFFWPTWSWVNIWARAGTVREVAADGSTASVQVECGICLVTNDTHQPGITSRAMQPGNRIYLANHTALLDEKGEYATSDSGSSNSDSGLMLYYAPRAGEDPTSQGAWVPAVDAVVALQGASNLTLAGIGFRDVSWHSRGNQEGFNQYDTAYGSPSDAAVVVAGGRGVSVENCSFVGVGGGGVLLSEGAVGTTVSGSLFSVVGQSGVMGIGNGTSQPRGAVISGNTMDRVGDTLSSAGGVFLTTASDTVVSGNTISNTSRWGVALRSNGDSALSRNVHIVGNRIARTGLHSRDYGGISTIDSSGGQNAGVIIDGNCVRDTIGADTDSNGTLHRPTWGWGLYLDNYSSNTVLRRNTVVNSSFTGVFYHEGHNNTVYNNIFAWNNLQDDFERAAIYVVPDKEWPANQSTRNAFYQNVVFQPGNPNGGAYPPTVVLVQDGRKDPAPYLVPDAVFGNVYFDPAYNFSASKTAFDVYSFEQWQHMGYDKDSAVADPLFSDSTGHDWTLRPGSPALARGFD